MDNLKLALDWTPNINHIGFYVAKAKGFYSDRSIDLDLLSPEEDNYETTPAKKVEMGHADFALCPMESILSYRTKQNPFNLCAIAAIYQEDISAIACLDNGVIESPNDLDGKIYASYQARYEDEIVKQMIKNDGGKGEIKIVYPDKLGIWDTIIEENSDATWIFLNWEGVQAEGEGLSLKLFKMKDYRIPYSYSPVIGTYEASVSKNEGPYKRFISGSKQGFLYAKDHPKEATEILSKHVPEKDRNIDLFKALDYSSRYFGDDENWGRMDFKNVETYLQWIADHQLETIAFNIVTNELIS